MCNNIQKIALRFPIGFFIIFAAILKVGGLYAQCSPEGDQVTYGDNEWIGYVYTNVDLSGPAGPTGAFAGAYSGYILPGQTFDVHLAQNEPLTGDNLCGSFLDTYSIRFKMHLDLEPGYYTFTVGGDDGYCLSPRQYQFAKF
ncbi:hypothetical protein OGH69_15025 [Flavobacterium sp. MFBS3-15]|uniref:hypothetical protein n=1 Tax=Flavobacterium sp. MFBS3-15 TaxID=2989816 RepID=UPI0022364AE1|nr:hypothetical protein [Flavobacterium sp. MFBS3-15]MCW4470286.1 hypothetical protein [Flavobacterium sp. MFBS3-15]